MKPEKIDWSVLQGAITVFLISMLISGALIGGAWYYDKEMLKKYNTDKNRFQAISGQYLAVDQEEQLIRQYYPKFIELYNKGVIGQERRLNWIETLRSSSEQIKLPALRYDIASQAKFSPDYPVNAGSFQVYSSPMKLNVDLLHELDLKKLLDSLNAEAPGTFNLSKCTFKRQGDLKFDNAAKGNISTECELRWFNIKKSDGSEIRLSS